MAGRTNALHFPALSDVPGQTGADFGLRFALPHYLVDLYKNLKNDSPIPISPNTAARMPSAALTLTRPDTSTAVSSPFWLNDQDSPPR
ncbi:hypothetical protein JOE11_002278 [Robbsia andropogonis]